MKKRAALHNLGCKVNAYETEAMEQLLEKAGYEIVDFSQQAEVYVINTCSVTNIADRKSRQMIHKAKNNNPNAIIVAAGCYVQTSLEKAKEDSSIDILIGNNKKHELVQRIQEFSQNREQVDGTIDISKDKIYESMELNHCGEHTRAFVKVQDGCNQFCSYCIIPYARGRVRSRALNEVLEEIKGLVKNGYKEVVLTGIHLSSYGVDFGMTLLQLIEGVHAVDGVERIRLGSLEPGIITEEFAKRLSQLEKVCPHFHLSLQSGCQETLERMNRRYTPKEYKERCVILRTFFEHPAITTDVIVGFPGETEEEFAITEQFLQEIHFYEVHLFKYSKRQGTKAALMEGQILESVKHERSAQLMKLVKEEKKKFISYYLNTEVEALMEEKEEINGELYFTGYTKEYVKMAVLAREEQEYGNQCYHGKAIAMLNCDILQLT
ncbi:MAG: tRNA (N(6)-L-threonylcarbamoyladenosine(37)-C(2))-methylthiotransferase MtaB [Lachnospiraceae bacterium]